VDVELEALIQRKERPAWQKLQNLQRWFAHRLMLKTMISPSLRPARNVSEKRQDLFWSYISRYISYHLVLLF
jgi:hypothetical protein